MSLMDDYEFSIMHREDDDKWRDMTEESCIKHFQE